MKAQLFKRTIFDSIIFAYLISIALIALTQPTEAQMLNLGFNAQLVLAFFVAGALASYALNQLNFKTLGELIFEPAYKKAASPEKSWYKTFWGWQLLIAFVTTFVVGAKATGISLCELTNEHGFAGAVRLFQGLANPNFDILPQAILNIFETIFIAFMATVIAIPVAFMTSFVCAKNIMRHPMAFAIYGILRTLLNVVRSVEPLIWAIIFSVWVGIGPFAGMLALMLHSVASLAKQYSELVEGVNDGPIEGIQATGAGFIQTIWFAIVPQVILPFIAFTIYRWDINVRMATIIGLVGGGGIGTMLIKYQGQAMWAEVGTIIIVIAVVVWLMDTGSAYIREAIK